MGAALGVLDGSAEDRHESVAEELVHDSLVFVDDVDHEVEHRVQIGHHGLRPLAGRVAAEVANIQKHHADVAQFAAELDRLMEQLFGDLRRDVLTEDPNRPIAILNRAQRDFDLALDLSSEQAGNKAGHKQDERADKLKNRRAPKRCLCFGLQICRSQSTRIRNAPLPRPSR